MTSTSPWLHSPRRRTFGWLLAGTLVIAGCAGPATGSPSRLPTSVPEAASGSPLPTSVLPTAAPSGFAFSAAAILGYYQSIGYACSEAQPSSTAAGYTYQSCESQDPMGRQLTVGLVTDPDGALADAFASVQGTVSETILSPSDAMGPLSAFLGATLGEQRGNDLLVWLAGHLGDEYAATTSADLTVGTYSASETDHSRLYVEVANQGYLDSPTPSGG